MPYMEIGEMYSLLLGLELDFKNVLSAGWDEVSQKNKTYLIN